jgi:hypothetical protein
VTIPSVPVAEAAEAVRAVVCAERSAKDLGRWDVMAAAFAPGATVRVSWFDGPATEFVARARERSARGGTPSFHEIGAVAVEVHGDRALADSSCAVHLRGLLDGTEVDVVTRGRLCWRVARTQDRWRIVSLDMIYIRDTLSMVDPAAAPPPAPRGSRAAYGFLQRFMESAGYPVSPDLPGTDRPELVAALLDSHRAWVHPVPSA